MKWEENGIWVVFFIGASEDGGKEVRRGEKCDVEVGPGVVLFGVYEKRGEKIMVMSFYFF